MGAVGNRGLRGSPSSLWARSLRPWRAAASTAAPPAGGGMMPAGTSIANLMASGRSHRRLRGNVERPAPLPEGSGRLVHGKRADSRGAPEDHHWLMRDFAISQLVGNGNRTRRSPG